jgi:hypothetical protein
MTFDTEADELKGPEKIHGPGHAHYSRLLGRSSFFLVVGKNFTRRRLTSSARDAPACDFPCPKRDICYFRAAEITKIARFSGFQSHGAAAGPGS